MQTAVTSVRLTESQFEKLSQMAESLNTSRNKFFGILIEHAEVESKPRVSVRGLENANSRSASAYQGKSATAVGR